MTVWKKAGLTGHRPQLLEQLGPARQSWLRETLFKVAVWLRDHRGTQVVVSGMAAGSDLMGAEAALAAGLALGAYVPWAQQTARWPASTRRLHGQLMALADPKHSRTEFPDEYSQKAITDRNHAVVDDTDALVAVWVADRCWGGTFHTLKYATGLRRPGVHIDPAAQTVRYSLPRLERTPDAQPLFDC